MSLMHFNKPSLNLELVAQTMKTHLSFIYFLSISVLVSSQSTDPSYYYNLCAPFSCGNIRIAFPLGPPARCHPSTLQLSCTTNRNFLMTNPTSSDTYRSLSINYTDPTSVSIIHASDTLFTCGSHISRPNYWNAVSLFSLPSTYTFGTHMNCTAPLTSNAYPDLQSATCLGCGDQDPSNLCYYVPRLLTGVPNCETYFIFRLINSSFNASMKNLREFLQTGFEIRYAKPVACTQCEETGGRCGTSPLSGDLICFCPSSVHRSNCTDGMVEDLSTWVNATRPRGQRPTKAVVAAISTSVSVLLLVVIVTLVAILVRRRKQDIHFNKETISSISPKRYSHSQLKKFTNNFESKLGEGGFGTVYKGTIHRSGVEIPVAVKMMKKSKQTEKQFINEVQTIGSVHHQNLLGMLGYCVERNTHALVYEFMENGSLDKYIYSNETKLVEDATKTENKKLSCKQVYKIALETAMGIRYLHQGCRNRILHCDIKPPNVLLDSNLSAKVADFGLSKMIDKDQSHVSLTGAQGTPGYAAPEMWLKTFGPLTDKSDVYSYGMLLLEMIGRRKNYNSEVANSSQVYFPEWLYKQIDKDKFPFLVNGGGGDDSFEIVGVGENLNKDDEATIQRMSLVGLWCIQHIPSNRPSMDRVVQMLEGHVEIGIPPDPYPQNMTRSDETPKDVVA